ncbi:probable nadp oxidoreductase, coenzyme f420-dependent; (partial sequence nterminus) protein [Ralstonia solanacearum IPO1609]|uniref:Probable nadp oxidoreductase, coenzyme f420-dependent (Partial sequence nterminus) protein n=1 Tax=Ralstonia solanacearum IPO1609 TaxID=564066 RepID=A0A7U7JDW4_RALSL|nr:probable nadp oxidoreductase, coenzyme f420-dependent; (partial sequence nterminus) protein [Ralstonia solanacearum IPO1609]
MKVRPGQRALYHAGANYAASFLLCALHEAATLWQAAGIGREEAVAAMWPLVDGTLAAARSKGLAGALAGPVSRGDGGVIDRHLRALDALGADHVALYAALTRRALALAAERGHPPADILATLAARLP